MFETLELGRRVKHKQFESAETDLRHRLLKAQFELAERPYPVIVIVSGVEGAGKGTVVHRFNKWMDARFIDTHAFWDSSDEENSRPFYWRFWRAMPAKGRIGVFFGSWYTKPIVDAALGHIDDERLDDELQHIAQMERLLTDDGALIVKLWFHISKGAQQNQLAQDIKIKHQNLRIPEAQAAFAKRYDSFARVSERAILKTDTHHAPWHLIEAEDPNYRDLTAGETLLRALQEHLQREPAGGPPELPVSLLEAKQPTILDGVPTNAKLSSDRYKKLLKKHQERLQDLAWKARKQKISCVAVFEGWDAAGKGSAIRRITEAIDPRLYRLVQFAAPTDEERAQHYLWRFWRQLAPAGSATLFDRSWYGRVLVERVEGFAHHDEWHRAYAEINRFEEQLAAHGIVVMKFWIHISKEEQLTRFKLREQTPHKQHKITEEDWRNREKWGDYELAVHDMVTHTSTRHAPWTLVAGNDKHYARVQILKTYCERLEEALGRPSNHEGDVEPR
jgi:polyphosphate:AMP phosphotransferase